MSKHPDVLWAQRSSPSVPEKNIIYLTVNVPDIIESTIKYELTATNISFAAKAGNPEKGIPERDYEFKLDFYEEVVPADSQKKVTTRSFNLILRKKEHKEEFWPRLMKEKVKAPYIRTDFDKWVDEDEQDTQPDKAEEGYGGMDDDFGMGGMGGMGGMPGMGGMGGMPGMGGMGGMPGMGGMGGMDMEKLMAQMGGAGGMGGPGGLGDGGDDDSDDDEGPPPLEDA